GRPSLFPPCYTGSMSGEMHVIHEFPITEMPKRRLLDLLRRGAKIYKLCETKGCVACGDYTPIVSELEIMTYCLQCGRKVLRYGVEHVVNE
ncbi:MAG: hypothetical protein AB1405_16480, partial [Bdellovibrionota bacterium]